MTRNTTAARPTNVPAIPPTTAVTLIDPDEDAGVPVAEGVAVVAGPRLPVIRVKLGCGVLKVAVEWTVTTAGPAEVVGAALEEGVEEEVVE